jgi:hypothetical protein
MPLRFPKFMALNTYRSIRQSQLRAKRQTRASLGIILIAIKCEGVYNIFRSEFRVGGGTGIRAWFRTMSRKGWRFNSSPTHPNKL